MKGRKKDKYVSRLILQNPVCSLTCPVAIYSLFPTLVHNGPFSTMMELGGQKQALIKNFKNGNPKKLVKETPTCTRIYNVKQLNMTKRLHLKNLCLC